MLFRSAIRALLVTSFSLQALAATSQFCKNNAGQTGVCMSTSACKSGKGTSEPGHCGGGSNIQCCTYGSCTGDGIPGWCMPSGACTGKKYPGANLCPGNNDIQCCTYGTCKTKNTPALSGKCQPTDSCKGQSHAGLCPGASSIQCCTVDTTPDPCKPVCKTRILDISASMYDFIKKEETPGGEWRPSPYGDPKKYPTIGWGHLCDIALAKSKGKPCTEVLTKYNVASFPLSRAVGEQMLRDDVYEARRCLTISTNSCVKLNQNQYDALVSVIFQQGCGNFRSGKIFSDLQACKSASSVVNAAALIRDYGSKGDSSVSGLDARRRREAAVFSTPTSKQVLPAGQECKVPRAPTCSA